MIMRYLACKGEIRLELLRWRLCVRKKKPQSVDAAVDWLTVYRGVCRWSVHHRLLSPVWTRGE